MKVFTMAIKFYSTKDAYGEFSNFAAFPFELGGLQWPTSEHYFQAQKFLDESYREKIRMTASPMIAARLGRSRSVAIRADWESAKIDVMRQAVAVKFRSHSRLRELLLATGDEEIIEATDGDYFWGCGAEGHGKNWLGRILMEVRDKLRKEVQP
jgi:ribA/ribD-fused uncharacterized protein